MRKFLLKNDTLTLNLTLYACSGTQGYPWIYSRVRRKMRTFLLLPTTGLWSNLQGGREVFFMKMVRRLIKIPSEYLTATVKGIKLTYLRRWCYRVCRVTWLSYENIGEIPEDTIGTPDMHFFIYESYLILTKKEKVYGWGQSTLVVTTMRCVKPGQVVPTSQTQAPNEFTLRFASLNFQIISKSLHGIWRLSAKKLTREGDMFQCKLSQRQRLWGRSFDYYRNLRVTNPSNYLYFNDFGDYQYWC